MASYEIQTCRICRCTQARGCASGCSWVELDLCSVCQIIRDVVLVLCSIVPRQMKRLVQLTEKALGDELEHDLDEKKIRKALADARTAREIELVTAMFYQVTPRGRRAAAKATVRVRRDVPALAYALETAA